MNSNRLKEPFLLITATLAIFLSLSLVNSEIAIGPYKSRRIDLLSDVAPKIGRAWGSPQLKSTFEQAASSNPKLKAVVEKIKGAGEPGISQFGNDSTGGLVHFYSALDSCKTNGKQVRIAYFGDSMIEGDLISQDLRSLLQNLFGGEGVGFVPVTSVTAGFRQTIIHSFSQNWSDYTILNNSDSHEPGITGHTFVPPQSSADTLTEQNCWVKLSSVSQSKLNRLPVVKLFYGKSEGENYVSVAGKTQKLEGKSTVNALELNSAPVQSIRVGFTCTAPPDVYGFSVESQTGVIVDNFSFRGNSGLPITNMPARLLSGFHSEMNYDLIILQYGVNVISSGVKDYSWYEKGMVRVVNHLKSSFPGASILIIGTGDKSYRENGEYVTDPAVPLVVDCQRKVAEKTGVAFFNLFETMGGHNSMVSWVKGDTVLANKDYTHLNFRGAKKVGKMLFDHLILEYKKERPEAMALGPDIKNKQEPN